MYNAILPPPPRADEFQERPGPHPSCSRVPRARFPPSSSTGYLSSPGSFGSIISPMGSGDARPSIRGLQAVPATSVRGSARTSTPYHASAQEKPGFVARYGLHVRLFAASWRDMSYMCAISRQQLVHKGDIAPRNPKILAREGEAASIGASAGASLPEARNGARRRLLR